MRPALSSTSTPNELTRRCLLRWQSERHSPAHRPPCRHLSGFSFNPRFLRVLASAYSQRRYGSSVRNFSDVPGKPDSNMFEKQNSLYRLKKGAECELENVFQAVCGSWFKCWVWAYRE